MAYINIIGNYIFQNGKKIGELPSEAIQEIEEKIFLNIQRILEEEDDEDEMDTQIFP